LNETTPLSAANRYHFIDAAIDWPTATSTRGEPLTARLDPTDIRWIAKVARCAAQFEGEA
jgi:hypothetical protein